MLKDLRFNKENVEEHLKAIEYFKGRARGRDMRVYTLSSH
jgi:hypothetical protein